MFKRLFNLLKQDHFYFAGWLVPARKKNCFTAALYKKQGDKDTSYVPELQGERIINFRPVLFKGKIHEITAQEQRKIQKGDDAIYCYVPKEGKVLWATRKELEPQLLQLLFDPSTSQSSGLILSSFLGFHGKTDQYLQEPMTSSSNITVHLDRNQFIQTTQDKNAGKAEFLEEIFGNLEKLKSSFPKVSLDDIALFQDSKIFYHMASCSINDVLFEDNDNYKKVFHKLITLSKKVYNEMLTSDLPVSQKKIDNILSKKAGSTNETILDIGVNIEAQLSARKEQSLIEVVNQIKLPDLEEKEFPKEQHKHLMEIANEIKLQMTSQYGQS